MQKTKDQLASDIINGRLVHYSDHSMFLKLYPFCNENVSGYLNFLDLKGKSLLTVGSSADQTISAISRGCTDITVLDINPFTEEYFYLKKAAISTLSPKEFSKLLFYKDYPHTFRYSKKPFDITAYPKMLKYLKKDRPDIYDFWLKLSKTNQGEIIRRSLFTQDEEKPLVTRQLIDYLKTDKAYYNTREQIQGINPTFINANITHGVPTDETFDNIVLSNLTSYLSYNEIKSLFESLIPHLNYDGKMMLGYMYRTDEFSSYCTDWNQIYDIQSILGIDPNIQIKSFQGVKGILFEDKTMKDAAYIYQKKK